MVLRFAFGLLVLLLFVACSGWLFWRSLKKNDDPARVVFYWVLTALLLGGGFFGIYKLSKDGTPEGKFSGLVLGGISTLAAARRRTPRRSIPSPNRATSKAATWRPFAKSARNLRSSQPT